MAPGLGTAAVPGSPRVATGRPTSSATISSLEPVEAEAAKHVAGLRPFFEACEGSSLRAWLRWFEGGHDLKVGVSEFMRGLRRMEHPGDAAAIFNVLDPHRSGEVSLEDIHMEAAATWHDFRSWCNHRFDSPREMLMALSKEEKATKASFREMLPKLGWTEGHEDMLFNALDLNDMGLLTASELHWLEADKRRQRRKEQAKQKAMQDTWRRAHECHAERRALQDFKVFLRQRYGNLVRAWRHALCSGDSMVLHKTEFFKACSRMGWPGDVRVLWKGLDTDDSGHAGIEELDITTTLALARFRVFMVEAFGSSAAAFQTLDRQHCGKVRQQDFVVNIKAFGFTGPAKLVFQALDINGHKSIREEDMSFIDRWKPPPYLLVEPNPRAAEEVKALLQDSFRNYLRAWRHCLDLDNSNHVSWKEFHAACKQPEPHGIAYKGDIAGAWRHLDADVSGYITLKEIDPASSKVLLGFKLWVDEEFGGARSAISVFHSETSNEVSYREFRKACRTYGYTGEVHALFKALDVERTGTLTVDEVAFLDSWEVLHRAQSMAGGDSLDQLSGGGSIQSSSRTLSTSESQLLTVYETLGPGPASYSVPSSLGAGPLAPVGRFSGSYTFRRKDLPLLQLPGIAAPRDAPLFPSPGDYDDRGSINALAPSKPACVFGRERRKVVEVPKKSPTDPGPGSYCTRLETEAPAYSCSPRRPLKAHPLFRFPVAEPPRSAR